MNPRLRKYLLHRRHYIPKPFPSQPIVPKLGTVPQENEIHEHYKRKTRYIVKGIARHSENPNRKYVVYSPVDNRSVMWVRPLRMWREHIEIEKEVFVPRFKLIKEVGTIWVIPKTLQNSIGRPSEHIVDRASEGKHVFRFREQDTVKHTQEMAESLFTIDVVSQSQLWPITMPFCSGDSVYRSVSSSQPYHFLRPSPHILIETLDKMIGYLVGYLGNKSSDSLQNLPKRPFKFETDSSASLQQLTVLAYQTLKDSMFIPTYNDHGLTSVVWMNSLEQDVAVKRFVQAVDALEPSVVASLFYLFFYAQNLRQVINEFLTVIPGANKKLPIVCFGATEPLQADKSVFVNPWTLASTHGYEHDESSLSITKVLALRHAFHRFIHAAITNVTTPKKRSIVAFNMSRTHAHLPLLWLLNHVSRLYTLPIVSTYPDCLWVANCMFAIVATICGCEVKYRPILRGGVGYITPVIRSAFSATPSQDLKEGATVKFGRSGFACTNVVIHFTRVLYNSVLQSQEKRFAEHGWAVATSGQYANSQRLVFDVPFFGNMKLASAHYQTELLTAGTPAFVENMNLSVESTHLPLFGKGTISITTPGAAPTSPSDGVRFDDQTTLKDLVLTFPDNAFTLFDENTSAYGDSLLGNAPFVMTAPSADRCFDIVSYPAPEYKQRERFDDKYWQLIGNAFSRAVASVAMLAGTWGKPKEAVSVHGFLASPFTTTSTYSLEPSAVATASTQTSVPASAAAPVQSVISTATAPTLGTPPKVTGRRRKRPREGMGPLAVARQQQHPPVPPAMPGPYHPYYQSPPVQYPSPPMSVPGAQQRQEQIFALGYPHATPQDDMSVSLDAMVNPDTWWPPEKLPQTFSQETIQGALAAAAAVAGANDGQLVIG